jgi:hypothetical protein
MKAFVSGVALMIVIAVIAWAVLDSVGMSSSDVFTSGGSVRL